MENLLFNIPETETIQFYGNTSAKFVVRPTLIEGVYIAENIYHHYFELVKLKNLPNPGAMFTDIPVYEKIYNRL